MQPTGVPQMGKSASMPTHYASQPRSAEGGKPTVKFVNPQEMTVKTRQRARAPVRLQHAFGVGIKVDALFIDESAVLHTVGRWRCGLVDPCSAVPGWIPCHARLRRPCNLRRAWNRSRASVRAPRWQAHRRDVSAHQEDELRLRVPFRDRRGDPNSYPNL